MDHALLLDDVEGEGRSRLPRLLRRPPPTVVLKGELLMSVPGDEIVPRSDGQKPHNYRVKKDPSISLYCSEANVAPLGQYEFLLLEAVSTPSARFSLFLSNNMLDWGQQLKPGGDVFVHMPGRTPYHTVAISQAAAKVRFVGGLGTDGPTGVFFGVEITDKKYRGQGTTDGVFTGTRYFKCEDNCGLFVPLDRLSPDREGSTLSQPPPGGQTLSGRSHEVDKPQGAANDRQGTKPGPSLLAYAYCHTPQPKQVTRAGDLTIGSMVQLSDPPWYGVIRWVGELPAVHGLVAGIEMENPIEGGTDGTWKQTGVRHFECEDRKGMFAPLHNLKPDQRFAVPRTSQGAVAMPNPLDGAKFDVQEDTHIAPHPTQIEKYLGENRGIQGHQNSCYLDATVFGLFALSDAFDEVFLKQPENDSGKEICKMFWKDIVNPLRTDGVVRYESVIAMRNKLEDLGKMKGVNHAEKDPEEFLNMLFKYTLDVEPFISIKRPFGVEKEFFVQLFMEFDERQQLPSVGSLLIKMFKEQNISFTQVPARLLIQVPRYGKKFKTYQKILPALKLDVKDVLSSSRVETEGLVPCYICNSKPGKLNCSTCAKETMFPSTCATFCESCYQLVHDSRPGHDVPTIVGEPNRVSESGPTELELLSVICIETSHYVCFARSEDQWVFFDSMANRVHDAYNIPKGVDCTKELNEWVYCRDHHRLLNTPPRELPECVRRFVQDVYMCVYTQPDVGIHGIPLELDERFIQPGSPLGFKPDERLAVSVKNPEPEKLQKEIMQLQLDKKELQEKVEQHQQETHQLEENLHQKRGKIQRLEENLHQKDQEMHQLEENLHHQQQQLVQTERTLRAQVQQLQGQAARYRDQVGELQAEVERMRLSPDPKLSLQEIEFWKIPRQEVQTFGEIGSGAWGYVAKGIFRGREVAVKWPHKEILDAYVIDRLRREVRIMAQVRHPNLLLFIAAVFDEQADRLQKPPLIITELLDINLRSAYKEGRLEYSSKLPIFRDIACALNYLHQHHEPIIHRDVSAPNVLLEALPRNQWKAKLSDFGSANLAKLARTAGEGAIIYSAPETFPLDIHDPNAVIPPQTTKIDVYSYGVVLCEVITSQMPASEKYRSMLQQVQRQWPFMYDLILSCTKRKPEERPTMAGVLSQLNGITP